MRKIVNAFMYWWLPLALCIHAARGFSAPLQLEAQYQAFEGPPVTLQSQLGKRPIYLKFWASWCLDCRKQMPDLQAVYSQYKDAISIYAVNLNINETAETLGAIKKQYHLTVPIVLDHNGSLAGNFRFVGTPFHVLINRQGEVVYTTYHADEKLHQKLDQLAHQSLVSGADDESVKDSLAETTSAHITLPQGLAIRYFSASWCDSYFVDIQPEMAKNCVRANNVVDALYQLTQSEQKLHADWQGYATHLWTTPEDLQAYQQSHNIRYPLRMDEDNRMARAYGVSQYPTLIVYKNGKEVKRLTQFEQAQPILAQLQALVQQH